VAKPKSRAFGENSLDDKMKAKKVRREKSFNEMLERFKKYDEVEERAAELDNAFDLERKAERKVKAVQARAVKKLARIQPLQLNTADKAARRKARAAIRRVKRDKMRLVRVASGSPASSPEARTVTKARKKVDSVARGLKKAAREAQKARGEDRRFIAAAKREERHMKRRKLGRPSATPERKRKGK